MSDNQGINNPKNKAYLNRALKKLSRKSEDERVSDIHKRIDKHNKQLAKKEVSIYHKSIFFFVVFFIILIIYFKKA